MATKESAHFRELEERRSCSNCANRFHSDHEGFSKCASIGHVFSWAVQALRVCDLHEWPQPLTAREKALKKLTPEDRAALGL